jgi:thiol-disulfide isomerase/thioredoxin
LEIHLMRHRLTLLACLTALCAAAPVSAGGLVGREFPDFQATDAVTGQTFALSDLRGKVVVLDFWATWCAPCRTELPHLKRLWERYQDDGLEIIGISLDQSDSKFRTFVSRNGMSWRQVREGGGWSTRLVRHAGVRSVPRLFVIAPDGTCVAESNRIGKLEHTIRDALTDVGPPPDVDPAVLAMRQRFNALHDSLGEVSEPIGVLETQLRRVEANVTSIERQLAGDSDPSTLQRRYVYLRRQLVQLRRDVFLLGLLIVDVSLPAEVFTPSASAADRERGLRREIVVARDAATTLRSLLTEERRTLDELKERVTAAKRGRSTESLDEIESEVAVVVDRLCCDNTTAVEHLQVRLGTRQRDVDRLAAELAAWRDRLASLRQALGPSSEEETVGRLRDRYGELVSGLREVAAQVAALATEADLPGGLAGPGLFTAEDATARLDAAAAVISRLDGTLASERRMIEIMALEAQRLRDAGEHPNGTVPVHPRLADLGGRILALDDRPPSADG